MPMFSETAALINVLQIPLYPFQSSTTEKWKKRNTYENKMIIEIELLFNNQVQYLQKLYFLLKCHPILETASLYKIIKYQVCSKRSRLTLRTSSNKIESMFYILLSHKRRVLVPISD